MGAPLHRSRSLKRKLVTPAAAWPCLDGGTLFRTRSRKVCLPCYRDGLLT
jgi:hypothetical protein